MWRDLRYSFRLLRLSPAFAAVAILTLGLGIGANTAIFSVVNAVLLRPLPYPDADRLVRVYETNTSIKDSHDSVSAPNFIDWRAQAHVFSGLAAARWEPFTVTGGATPEFIYGQRVTPEMLAILGIHPEFGRNFSPEDAVPGADQVVLLSHELWVRRYASDRGMIGREIVLNFEKYTVIGILPAGFRSPSQFGSPDPVELLLPLAFTSTELQNRGSHNSQVFGRLRPGVSVEQAQADMNGIADRLAKTYPGNVGRGARVVGLMDEVAGNFRASLLILFAAAGVILLITCANLANVLLARDAGRTREIAVRLAIGASRVIVIRELLIQNLVLASLGCAFGLITAFAAVKGLHLLAPANLPRLNEVGIDGATLGFAAVVAIVTALAFGLLPALHLSASRPYDAMKGRGAAAAGSAVLRWRNVLIAAQVALSIVLLVGAGLLLKSFARLRGIDIGFQPSRTLALRIMLPKTRYPDAQKRIRFFDAVAERVRTLPGVEAVGYTNQLPMRGGWGGSFNVPDPEVAMGPNDDADFQIASPQYFAALGIKLLRGRIFSAADRPGAQLVAIVNHAFAHRYWPNRNPIGEQVSKAGRTRTIVGVVDDVHLEGPASPANIEIYFPSGQADVLPVGPGDLAVRAAGNPISLVTAVQREVWAVDKEQPVSAVREMDDVLAQSTAGNRLDALLVTMFAALALLLAAIGIYGVVSYSVAQRSAEIGIRMAVGARPGDVFSLLFRQISSTIGIGCAIGVLVSLALTRYASSLLFDVAPRDPATFAIAIGVLLLAGLAAALLPAARATRLDPISVLRVE